MENRNDRKIDFTGKKVTVVGFKRTGIALAAFLAARNARVTITDAGSAESLRSSIESIDRIKNRENIFLELGEHRDETFVSADFIILSPGVPETLGPIKRAAAANVPVMGEMELAGRFIDEPIVAISGTNGKTTTTTLLGEMLTGSGITNFVGGNIGNPLIAYADEKKKVEVVVAEVSSFQLDTTTTFRPKVGVLLNITDDHLDRYENRTAYAKSKFRLFANQLPTDIAILNAGDIAAYPFLQEAKSRKLLFNLDADQRRSGISEGAFIHAGKIVLQYSGRTLQIDSSRIHLVGRHNLENIAAAALGAFAIGATPQGIQTAVDQFKGLSHRLTHVETINGVKYYDDSKATNVDAVIKAIETFAEPIVLIMGGRDKGSDFSILKESAAGRVKQLILIGEAAEIISGALESVVPTVRAASMEAAVDIAREKAGSGDVVLLAPGCASFDMYENYAARGAAFESAVRKIKSDRKIQSDRKSKAERGEC